MNVENEGIKKGDVIGVLEVLDALGLHPGNDVDEPRHQRDAVDIADA